MTDANYSIAELAQLGGVSRRTVRYYIQENLLPPPLGVGRGPHYGADHLERLLAVKAMQERGMSLEGIRDAGSAGKRQFLAAAKVRPVERSQWTRIDVLPGIELHVSGDYRLPAPIKLAELGEWCRQAFRRQEEE